jgi:hypothetical protein
VNSYPFDFVKILWQDAETDDGWKLDSELEPKEHTCVTVGFLIRRERKFYLVASTISINGDEPETCSRMQIPRGMVQSLTILEPRAPKKKVKANV